MRAASGRTGLRVGGYGWVENLNPAPAGASPVPPPAGETGPMFAQPDDSGFIHAPSMTHARGRGAAAQRAPRRDARGERRQPVRDRPVVAPRCATRGGCSTACARASRWARCSATASNAACTSAASTTDRAFRRMAPLVAGNARAAGRRSAESSRRRTSSTAWCCSAGDAQRASPTPLLARCDAVLDELAEALDAVADALVAETMYQAVRGNSARTAATLAGDGGRRPAAARARVGAHAAHRHRRHAPPGAAAGRRRPRRRRGPRRRFAARAAEPMLNAWAARLLGPRKGAWWSNGVAGATLVKTHELRCPT